MQVHVFENRTSPAIAGYGLRHTANDAESTFGHDVTDFVNNNFYVDDGLTFLRTPEEAIYLVS